MPCGSAQVKRDRALSLSFSLLQTCASQHAAGAISHPEACPDHSTSVCRNTLLFIKKTKQKNHAWFDCTDTIPAVKIKFAYKRAVLF